MLVNLRSLLMLATALAFIAPGNGSCDAFARAQGITGPFTPTRFTVVDEGTRGMPDVILIPGLTSSRQVWAAEVAKLGPAYRLHLVQVNGFAGQPAGKDVAEGALLPEIVDQLHQYVASKKMHPIVMGHSLGGLLTLMLAEKYPNDPSKIVIVDALPFVGLMFGPGATVDSVSPMAKTMRDGTLTATPAQRESVEKRTAETLVLSPGGRRQVVADGLASDPRISAQAMYEDFQTDLRPELPTIKTPALVLYAYDPTLTFPNGMKPTRDVADAITSDAYKAMPNVKLVRVDNSRHFIMFDQPQEFHEQLMRFLSR